MEVTRSEKCVYLSFIPLSWLRAQLVSLSSLDVPPFLVLAVFLAGRGQPSRLLKTYWVPDSVPAY